MTDKTIGHNSGLSKMDKAKIATLTEEIESYEDKRADINAKINSNRKQIKAFGIDLDAYRAAKRRKQMDPDKRADFDRSQAICNEALGVPVQADLFAPAENDDGNPIPSAA